VRLHAAVRYVAPLGIPNAHEMISPVVCRMTSRNLVADRQRRRPADLRETGIGLVLYSPLGRG